MAENKHVTITMLINRSFTGVNRPGREINNPLQSSDKAKNEWRYMSTPLPPPRTPSWGR